MKTLKILFALIFISINSYSQSVVSIGDSIPEAFKKKLNDGQIRFNKPKESIAVRPIANSPFKYEYAVSLKGKDVEIRYSIWPLSKKTFEVYVNRTKQSGDTILHPNNLHMLLAPTAFSEISGGKISNSEIKLKTYPAARAKKEFGADAGYVYMGPVGSSYSDKYEFGFFVILHKDFVGNAFISYLFRDEETMLDQMSDLVSNEDVFKALVFK